MTGLRSYSLLCLAMLLDKADQQLLPAVFLEVCGDLDAGPSLLGTITLCRGMAMSLIALAAGPLSKRFDRINICAAGVALWGVATAVVGMAPSLGVLLIGRTINGLGLGLVIPVVFSLVADMFPPSQRGAAFGVLGCCGNLGGLSGALLATELASTDVLGLAGWRAAFHIVALASLLVAVALLLFARDPQQRVNASGPPLTCATTIADMRTVLRLPTFGIILAQGAFGTVPWYSIGFFVMWLQLSGHSHHASALIRLAFDLGVTAGTRATHRIRTCTALPQVLPACLGARPYQEGPYQERPGSHSPVDRSTRRLFERPRRTMLSRPRPRGGGPNLGGIRDPALPCGAVGATCHRRDRRGVLRRPAAHWRSDLLVPGGMDPTAPLREPTSPHLVPTRANPCQPVPTPPDCLSSPVVIRYRPTPCHATPYPPLPSASASPSRSPSPSHRIPPHRIASHRIASHRIASHPATDPIPDPAPDPASH